MYAGRIVEEGPAGALLARPHHPYTRGLLGSVPDPGQPRRLESIPGVAVGVGERPDGCAFAPRCLQRTGDRALHEMPPLEDVGAGPPRSLLRVGADAAAGSAGTGGRRALEQERPLLGVEALRAEHGGRQDTSWPSATCPSRLRAVSASRSSASRGAARRRSPVASWASIRRRQDASSSTGRPSPTGGRARERRGGASRSSFRTPTTRSTLAIVSATRSRGRRASSAISPRARRRRRPPGSSSASGFLRAWPSVFRGALGRRAPAGRDRARPGRPARSRRLRRDHVGARRLRAGGGAGAPRRASGRASSRAPLHHARPRGRRLDRRPRARPRGRSRLRRRAGAGTSPQSRARVHAPPRRGRSAPATADGGCVSVPPLGSVGGESHGPLLWEEGPGSHTSHAHRPEVGL